MKHLLLCGFYGSGNLGDDALLLSFLRVRSEVCPSLRVSFLSGGVPLPYALDGGVTEVPRMHPRLLSALRSADAVAFGGGSVLQSSTSRRSLFYYLSLLSLAEGLGKETALVASGLGPIGAGAEERLTKRALSRLSYASFRDSAALLEAEGRFGIKHAHLSADPALLLGEKSPRLSLPRRFLLVSLRKRNGDSASEMAEAVACAARQCGGAPLFVDLFPKEDAAFTRAVAASLWERRTAAFRLPTLSPEELLFVTRRATAVFTGRYHLALFAYRAGIPATILGDDPKLAAERAETRPPAVAERAVRDDLFRFFSRFS